MNSTAQCSGASQTVWGGYDEGGETCKARVKLWLWSKGHLTAFTPTSLWFYRLWQWTKMSRSCYIHTLNVWMFFLHDEMKCCVCVCVRMCVFTSWLMCTDCRLLMWPDWILLAACDTACNTDLCWWANPQFQIKLHHHLWPTTTQSNDKYSVCLCVCVCVCGACLTCEVVCTGWTTWVGTPGAGGLESDRLSLEWTEPSGDHTGRTKERRFIRSSNKYHQKIQPSAPHV